MQVSGLAEIKGVRNISMLQVNDQIFLHEDELEEEFVRSSGPGGQHVNRVSTAVQLRFDVKHSPCLPEYVRRRVLEIGGSKVTREGEIVIQASRHRTQEQNRQDARDRLVKLIARAAKKPKPRKATKPSAAARKKRLEKKKQHSEKKKLRQQPPL